MLWPIDFAKEHGVIIETKDPMPGYTRVPAGTSVTFYSRHGQPLSDALGNAIEQGTVNKNQPRETYGPGELIPDYRIYPPGNLNIAKGGKDTTVVTLEHPTQLSSLLKEGMGKVDFAACRSDKHFPAGPQAIDWNTFGDKKKE
ncbi:MAG TPA: hypothetical protein VNM37_22930, partial [Candidatus Dormibacteraeota bacterium]|nr:hypothetical protein [Candidatus Dormibacteraeota bacterium]